MWPTPAAASWWTTMSRIARSPTGSSGFGSTVVYGSRREPRPPARMTARSTGKAAILVVDDPAGCHTARGCRPGAVGAGLARARGARAGRGAVPVLRLAHGVGALARSRAARGACRRLAGGTARPWAHRTVARGALALRRMAGVIHARAAGGRGRGGRGVDGPRRLASRRRTAMGDARRRGSPVRGSGAAAGRAGGTVRIARAPTAGQRRGL